MRAVIKCEFIFKGGLRERQRAVRINKFLEHLPWNSPLLSHHEDVAPKLEQVLQEFPSIRNYLDSTTLNSIYLPASETWGIITEATIGAIIDIRLTNKLAEHLKQACEDVVLTLVRAASLRSNRSEFKISFRIIHILEKESDAPVYIGEPVIQRPVRFALRNQKLEKIIGITSSFIAITSLFLSSPIAETVYRHIESQEWASWVDNFLLQISVATLATAFISFLKITLYAFDIRREQPIYWRLSRPA